MTLPTWDKPVAEIAPALLGLILCFPGNLKAVILEVKPYPRNQNSGGAFAPILEMGPGEVYCINYRGNFFLNVVVANGDCFLVTKARINGQIVEGPGRITKALGITQKSWGTATWIDNDSAFVALCPA